MYTHAQIRSVLGRKTADFYYVQLRTKKSAEAGLARKVVGVAMRVHRVGGRSKGCVGVIVGEFVGKFEGVGFERWVRRVVGRERRAKERREKGAKEQKSEIQTDSSADQQLTRLSPLLPVQPSSYIGKPNVLEKHIPLQQVHNYYTPQDLINTALNPSGLSGSEDDFPIRNKRYRSTSSSSSMTQARVDNNNIRRDEDVVPVPRLVGYQSPLSLPSPRAFFRRTEWPHVISDDRAQMSEEVLVDGAEVEVEVEAEAGYKSPNDDDDDDNASSATFC